MTPNTTSTDPFAMLEEDHREVEALLHRLSMAASENADDAQAAALSELQQALSVHMDFEESEIYPLVARTIEVDLADEQHSEHDDVRVSLARLASLVGDEQFAFVLAEVQGAIARHVGVEESELFPRLREEVGPGEQEHLAGSLTALRAAAR